MNRSFRFSRALTPLGAVVAAVLLAAGRGVAQQTPQAPERGTRGMVVDTVHSRVLQSNKYGDSPNREVLVYLPPSYDSSTARRYPVIYLLHGFGSSDRSWARGYGTFSIGAAMDSLIAAGTVREMIVVMPSARTRLGGSFYVNSESTGDWEDFITRELVAYIDGKYRTLARAGSRGLAGHSMGGYGTFALGEHDAGDVYGALYAMSGCCTHFAREMTADQAPIWETLTHVESMSEVQSLGFYPEVFLAMSAAFSPNIDRRPLYVDFPFELKDGQWKGVPTVMGEWIEHSPYDMVPRYAEKLKRLRGFAFDVGTRDQLVPPSTIAAMDSALKRMGVPHTYETYDGDHASGIGLRMTTKVLPFFSQTLDFSTERH
jgi:S-formylglutathione hydrolase FrmB